MPISFVQLHQVEPSPVARRLLWHVLSIGRVWRDELEAHPALDKAGVFLFRVVSGRGVLMLPGQRWELCAGPRCWLVDMGQRRTYQPAAGQRLVTTGFRFAGPGLDAWREALAGGGEFRFESLAEMMFLRRAEERLLQLVTRRPAGYEWQVHEIITGVLGRLLAARRVFTALSPTAPAPVRRVLDGVLADPARAWRASELAGIARLSYSGLRALFRATQHESLHDFLRRTRLDQAQLLLADDRLAVKEVALRLNFSSEFYFSHWFRRNTGVNPSQFRRSARD
ncbi:MAG: AraC family transcriptional regulator [Verrucomicrobiia bacterium]|jgi:AraC-like DNA-binding protein